MFRVLLVTKNKALSDICRKSLPEAFELKVVSKLNPRTESAHAIIVFDSEYLTLETPAILSATAERFGVEDGAVSVNILMNEESKARMISLFPEDLRHVQAILYYRIESGKIQGLTAFEWRWFLETQQRTLRQFSERAMTVGENQILAERLSQIKNSAQPEIKFPAFMQGRSQVIIRFREKLLTLAAAAPVILITGGDELPAEDFLEYYVSLLRPENPPAFQIIDLEKIPRHLHAQALWGQKKKSADKLAVACVRNLHLLGWQNQATLTHHLKLANEAKKRYICVAPRELTQEVRRGKFRQELYSLLRKSAIELPPLYDRAEDLSQIAAEYISKNNFTPLAEQKSEIARKILTRFDLSSGYRGLFMTLDLMNDLKKSKGLPVFELMNAGDGTEAFKAAQSFLREEVEPDPATLFENLAGSERESLSLDFVERNYIAAVCQRYAWQVTDAARHLGISRKTLYDKIRRYKITRPENPARGKARKAS